MNDTEPVAPGEVTCAVIVTLCPNMDAGGDTPANAVVVEI
jgi:hypothetical protein